MGTDLPSTAPPRGAIARGVRKIVISEPPPLWWVLAGDLHAERGVYAARDGGVNPAE